MVLLALTLATGMLGGGSDSLAPVLVSESGNLNQKLASPLWQLLGNMSQSDRENASIQLEADNRCSAANLDLSKKAEALWNKGRFEAAIDALHTLEAAGGQFAVGISWKRPKESTASVQVSTIEATALQDSGDVRIGTRTGISKSTLDFNAQNGNLFAVLKFTEGSAGYWTVNISTNGGRSWLETFVYSDPIAVTDITAAVVGDYLYVAYVVGTSPNEARIRRQFVFSGGTDGDFSFKKVFDKGTPISELCLVSSADGNDDRLYYFAILTDHKLIHYWAYNVNTPTLAWNERLTGVSNAGAGLSVTFNINALSGYAVFASYIASDGTFPVMVWRSADSTWGTIEVQAQYTGSEDITSISAYNDTVICAFEHAFATGQGIRCQISYNGGGTWNGNDFQPPFVNYQCPDVTARGGKGTALIFSEEAGEPDFVWFRFRAGYQPGPWKAAIRINQLDVSTGSLHRIQWLPPRTRGGSSYGAIYLSGVNPIKTAYFSRMDLGASLSWLMLLLE